MCTDFKMLKVKVPIIFFGTQGFFGRQGWTLGQTRGSVANQGRFVVTPSQGFMTTHPHLRE
jgi:hypothetical protein